MQAPAFWQRPPGLLARLLAPAASAYGALAGRRMGRAGVPAPVPVICVGNFTVGGVGKTPAALALADLLAGLGRRPAFLSRGYGGSLAGPLRVDPARHGVDEVGDEPLLLARAAPAIVARDRIAGAALCAEAGAEVIVMDDGLQNPSLRKDLALALVDASAGLGNGYCLPAGPLRAPMPAQWPRVDAVLVVGEGSRAEATAAEAARRGLPVLRARLVPEGDAASRLAGRRVLAFAGIGRPEKFFATLEACGAELVRRRSFPDHHAYRETEIAALLAEAERDRLVPVTTEKDWVRMGRMPAAAAVATLPVRLAFDDPVALQALVQGALEAASGRTGAAR